LIIRGGNNIYATTSRPVIIGIPRAGSRGDRRSSHVLGEDVGAFVVLKPTRH